MPGPVDGSVATVVTITEPEAVPDRSSDLFPSQDISKIETRETDHTVLESFLMFIYRTDRFVPQWTSVYIRVQNEALTGLVIAKLLASSTDQRKKNIPRRETARVD